MFGQIALCIVVGAAETYPVTDYADRVVSATFSEQWPAADGSERAVEVTAEIWTAAIQAALDEHGRVDIPRRDAPYYIDAPIIMRSGYALVAEPGAEIRLKPGSNCCMVRNEHLVSGQNGPVTVGDSAESDMVVRGGIWTTLATSRAQSNGNLRADARMSTPINCHGTIAFSNARNFVVENVTIRECRPHGIQLSNCEDFIVSGIRLENQRRDGVHINGPAKDGVIRDVVVARGTMGDDLVALNAWDWMNTSTSFGPITNIVVENVQGASGGFGEPDTRSEIRLLAGTKRFADGSTLDCDITDCVFRSIRGIRTFKMYDQPNLELGRNRDFADPIGTLSNILFQDIHVEAPVRPALFQIAMNGEDIVIENVQLGFAPALDDGSTFKLVEVGPVSQTYKHNPADPNTWVEIFSPDKDCTVKGLRVANVRADATSVDPGALISVITQTVNQDYPNTTPRGGTGKGILVP